MSFSLAVGVKVFTELKVQLALGSVTKLPKEKGFQNLDKYTEEIFVRETKYRLSIIVNAKNNYDADW